MELLLSVVFVYVSSGISGSYDCWNGELSYALMKWWRFRLVVDVCVVSVTYTDIVGNCIHSFFIWT